ncbi:MAG: alpha/beta hydrolase [Oscillospiraceae bacterium]|nr:alpha/beta hydrolase [Oscillospiraceae bacterium]
MVKVWDIAIPELSGDKTRRVYLYLPDYYDEDDRRYPVMYMFDGHNVFFDSDATYGKSWGMNSYMNWTKTPLIIVAVECNHEGDSRLSEYSPLDFENSTLGRVEGKGKIYMDWLVGTLKPQIDRDYRTLSDREHTIICGSSMGGLMSLYAAVCYNKYFQRAACLSPSLWIDPGKILEMIATAKIKGDTCIYMDYGSKEIFNHSSSSEALISVSHMLLTKRVNLTFRIVPGGTHSEASWEQQIPIFMECLGL